MLVMSKPSHSLLHLSGNRIGPLRCCTRGRRAEVRGCESDWDPRLDVQQTNTSRFPFLHPVSSSPLSKTSSPRDMLAPWMSKGWYRGRRACRSAHRQIRHRGRSPPATERKKETKTCRTMHRCKWQTYPLVGGMGTRRVRAHHEHLLSQWVRAFV